jgi:hypothetical protein
MHLALYSACRLAKPIRFRSYDGGAAVVPRGVVHQLPLQAIPAVIGSRFLLGYGPLAFASIGLPQGCAFQLCKAGASVPEVVYTRIPFGTKCMLTN